MRRSIRDAGSIAGLAAVVAVAVAACGGSGSISGGTTTASAGSSPIALSKCMRRHGVTDYPNPSFNGPAAASKQLNSQTPAFQRAAHVCLARGNFKVGVSDG
jgi:hypothetical protein